MSATPEKEPERASEGGKTSGPRWHRVFWGLFRCARTALIVLLLLLLVLGLFLNKVGLPGFVKNRVVAAARSKGLQVEFSRLRLLWYRGVVADDLHLRSTNAAPGPELFVEHAECPLDPVALKNFSFKINSLRLEGGRLFWPLTLTNGPRRTLVLNNVSGEMRFLPDDVWELRSLRGDYHHVKLELSGALAHAAALGRLKLPVRPKTPGAPTPSALHQLETLLSRLELAGQPEVHLRFVGDAEHPATLSANFYANLTGLHSPWATGTNLLLTAQFAPSPRTNALPGLTLKLEAEDVQTPWGRSRSANVDLQLESLSALSANALPPGLNLGLELLEPAARWGTAENLSIAAHSVSCPTNAALVQTELSAISKNPVTQWGKAAGAQLTFFGSHNVTNLASIEMRCDMTAENAFTRWGEARQAQVHASGAWPASTDQLLQTNLAWPERLSGIPFAASALLSNSRLKDVDSKTLSISVENGHSRFDVASSGDLSGGGFSLRAQLDPATRELSFSGSSAVDAQRLSKWLSTNSQKWLSNYQFKVPPKFQAQGRLVLPSWTNTALDWTRDVLPGLSLAGSFEAGPGAYRGLSFASAQSPFTFTNSLWELPALKVTRPEGALEARYRSNPLTREFHWQVHSEIDPTIAKPLFPKKLVRQAFDFFKFTSPPIIDAEITGSWLEPERLSASAQLSASNFTVRGEAVKECSTRFQYTNHLLSFFDARVEREKGEHGTAAGIAVDLRAQKLYFTNGLSTLNPYAVARAIGDYAFDAIAPYQFDSPPTVRLHGAVDLKRKRYEEDLHFEVAGGFFHWGQLRLEQLVGNVDWVGQTLAVTNVLGGFRAGQLTGHAWFDFGGLDDAQFSLKTTWEGVDLRQLDTRSPGKTNRLEGLLDGELVITNALAGDPNTWQGYGRVNLRDGLIWDIPMFGVFSPVLNAFAPGLGNSRANEASATFLLVDGIFSSKDLEIRATMMRMALQGTIGLNRKVNTTVEAELLRDVPAVGIVISKVFWPVTKIFEYKVTGTLAEPKAEPLYVLPKILLMPFHPLKTLKGLLTDESKESEEKKPPP